MQHGSNPLLSNETRSAVATQLLEGPTLALSLALLAASSAPASAALPLVASVLATPRVASPGDGDDPSVWLHPTDATKSLVITRVKAAACGSTTSPDTSSGAI